MAVNTNYYDLLEQFTIQFYQKNREKFQNIIIERLQKKAFEDERKRPQRNTSEFPQQIKVVPTIEIIENTRQFPKASYQYSSATYYNSQLL